MKIPYKLNPFGKSDGGVDLTKGLDFYCPFDENLTDTINNLTGYSSAGTTYVKLENDSGSNIGNCLKMSVSYSSTYRALQYANSARFMSIWN